MVIREKVFKEVEKGNITRRRGSQMCGLAYVTFCKAYKIWREERPIPKKTKVYKIVKCQKCGKKIKTELDNLGIPYIRLCKICKISNARISQRNRVLQ